MIAVEKTELKEVKTTVYKARDGKEFDNEYECEKYESQTYFNELWKTLEAKYLRCGLPFIEGYDKFALFSFKYTEKNKYNVVDFLDLLVSNNYCCQTNTINKDLSLIQPVVNVREYLQDVNFEENKIYIFGIKYSQDFGNFNKAFERTHYRIFSERDFQEEFNKSLLKYYYIFRNPIPMEDIKWKL